MYFWLPFLVAFVCSFVPNDLNRWLRFCMHQGSAVEDSVSFFMAQNSSGEDAVRRTWYFAAVWFVLQIAVGLSMVPIFPLCIFLFFRFVIIIFFIIIIVYFLLVSACFCDGIRHSGVTIWI
jgi:hypothetical protein